MNARKSAIWNLMPPFAMLAFSAVFLVWSYTYGERGQQVPVLVGWVMVFLCVLDVVASSGTRTGDMVRAFFSGTLIGEEAGAAAGKPLDRTLTAILWPTMFVVLVAAFGFMPVIPVYAFLFVVAQGRKTVRQGIISAAVTTLFTYVVFEVLLRYEVYRGLVFSS
jgi:hypothetical protein